MQNFSKGERIVAALYLIWFFLHVGFFFSSDQSTDNTYFWPFIKQGMSLSTTYDVSEFLVYIGVPLILYFAYRIVTGDEYDEADSGRRHSGTSFLVAFLDEKIKAEELTQKINELTGKPVSYSLLEELKADRNKLNSHNVKTWLDRVEVKKKYKEFENKLS